MGFQQAKKNPHDGGFYLTAMRLAGVHAPPEDVAEDDNLLFLDLLEGVVLVRMFIAIEAAQANPRGQAIKLFNPQLAVVVDRIKVAIDDIADPALAGIDPYGGAVTQYRQHAVTTHRHAFGLVELHTVMAQAALAEAQARALAFFDDESS
ncbi:hypothetical protein D3C84_864330 [compost metagenome]